MNVYHGLLGNVNAFQPRPQDIRLRAAIECRESKIEVETPYSDFSSVLREVETLAIECGVINELLGWDFVQRREMILMARPGIELYPDDPESDRAVIYSRAEGFPDYKMRVREEFPIVSGDASGEALYKVIYSSAQADWSPSGPACMTEHQKLVILQLTGHQALNSFKELAIYTFSRTRVWEEKPQVVHATMRLGSSYPTRDTLSATCPGFLEEVKVTEDGFVEIAVRQVCVDGKSRYVIEVEQVGTSSYSDSMTDFITRLTEAFAFQEAVLF